MAGCTADAVLRPHHRIYRDQSHQARCTITGLDEVKVGVAYQYKGQYPDTMPACLKTLSECEVQYKIMPRWSEDISTSTTFEDLPVNAQRYVLRVQELLGVPVRWIGVGQSYGSD